LLGVLSCSRQPDGAPTPTTEAAEPPWFIDITDEAGLDFLHDAGKVETYFMPQQVGSGAAIFDFNNDGLLDILLLQNGGPDGPKNRLYQGLPGGRFKDVSAGSGLDFAGHNMGVAVADVNHDGWPDVLVTQYGGIRLLLNNRDGTFIDVTHEAGLSNPNWATSAAFVDYDRDGWLDLVVVNYLSYDPSFPCYNPNGQKDFCAPKTFHGTISQLFHHEGKCDSTNPRLRVPLVKFKNVTIASGLAKQPGPGLGVLCYDFDGDGWPDVFIANDGKPNHLWINQRDGTFKEEAAIRGLAVSAMGQAEANMGIALGDVDGDGLMDLFVTHLGTETNTFWKQTRRGIFRDETTAAGLAFPQWRGDGFGTLLADFDQDGALDLAIVNGRVAKGAKEHNPELGPFWAQYGDRNQLFAGDGTGKFRDVSTLNPALCGSYRVCRGLACADFNGDGALDLLVTAVAGRARLYRNVAPTRGHWLLVRALDPELKRDAIGAEVRVEAGKRRWLRLIDPNTGYLCSQDPRAHFGLGTADRVDAIHVLWPDGKRERFECPGADRVVELRKGAGKPQ
jgi:hypothetical protein